MKHKVLQAFVYFSGLKHHHKQWKHEVLSSILNGQVGRVRRPTLFINWLITD
jgi:hypothetical protein